ncbi:glycosyltransferase [Plantactinospora sp. BC1]|uniref:glycosyltransferase n=1 Tax=Plantactinospora sp. BC1 TaxID=2108470 RepID=UPI000D1778F4|nr:glycosyltransferase [Plantactinospora sp. BC1]AVT28934.1 glycosyltransferase [Plantactinospora sp. BC1]
MSDFFDAFEMSPLSERGPKAVAPEVFRGIYAMPVFVTIPTSDLAASTDFWVRGFGFIELFSIPGQVVHLRRWAFQDVLLVPATPGAERTEAPAMSVSFACVLDEIDPIVAACTELAPGSVTGPRDTPWTTRDVEVVTPERARVVFTAPKEFDPDSQEARDLASVGIVAPGSADEGHRGEHG